MPRILITGGAGFLGSHLCDKFIDKGYEVIAMDNLLTGKLSNIEHLFPLKQFHFYNHDVSNCTRSGKTGLYPAFCFTGKSDRLFKNAYSDFESRCFGYS